MSNVLLPLHLLLASCCAFSFDKEHLIDFSLPSCSTQCDAKIAAAEAIAQQATADLIVVTRLLTLHDAMAVRVRVPFGLSLTVIDATMIDTTMIFHLQELRLDGWKAHAERLKSSSDDLLTQAVTATADHSNQGTARSLAVSDDGIVNDDDDSNDSDVVNIDRDISGYRL